MAASDSQLAAGRRLASDLRSIRRKHGVDRKEVLDATRLADDVIEQLEEDALVNHPAFNRVYLRSLLKAYAGAIGVREADMIAALDEMFDGHYVGSLASIYLGVTEDDASLDLEMSWVDVGSGDQSDEPEDTSNKGEDPVADGASGDDETDVVEDVEGEDDLVAPFASSTTTAAEDTDVDSKGESEDAGEEESSDSRPERVAVKGSMPSSAGQETVWTGLASKKTVLLPNMSGTALVIIAGVAFVSLLWFAVSAVLDMTSGPDEDVALPDSAAVEEVFRPTPVVLPDTLEVAIVAYTEILDPIRVTADRDLRKPYWVELLDTHYVAITERILLEREADHTRVLVDGFLVPERWLMEEQPVEISRQRVQTWLDSLVAAGVAPQREPPPAPAAPLIEPDTSVVSLETP